MPEQVEAVPQRQVPPQRRALSEDHPQAMGQLHPLPGRIKTADPDAAGGGRQDSDEHFDGRGLAGAVRAQIPDHLAGPDAEGQIGYGRHVHSFAAKPAGPAPQHERLFDLGDIDHGIGIGIGAVRVSCALPPIVWIIGLPCGRLARHGHSQ